MSEEISFTQIRRRVEDFWDYIFKKYEFFNKKMTSYEDTGDMYKFFCYFIYGKDNERSLGVVLQFMKSTLQTDYETVINEHFRECELEIEETIQKHLDELKSLMEE